ncbi:regulatory protein SoxS [Salmonella enterica subsp. enterica serovar Typhi]|nr:regulatory protein SoxS [Salmonella enterica subsp. enterica serovar Typhi]CWY13207.1 regulatory protein SoxS [Salmonella enterica subsp. enterica serovar Typhi]
MSHQQIIQTLIEWIDEHINQPLNIDVVAKKSGYSKWYLQRMFRTVTHQTLGEYIRQRRLLLAAVELRTTERPIFDIAMDLGYVSQQTFSRVFRREFDRTPSDYRHRLWGVCPRIVRGAGVCCSQTMNSCGGNAFAKCHP